MSSSTDSREQLAINLKKLMDKHGYSAREVERRSGVSARMIGYILKQERGASVEIVESIARAFRTTTAVLISNLSDLDIEHLSLLEGLTDQERVEISKYASYLISNRPGDG